MKHKPVDKKKIKKVAGKKRLSTTEIKMHLELLLELEKAQLTKAQHSLPSLDVMKDIEQARARIRLCGDMLAMFWWDRR